MPAKKFLCKTKNTSVYILKKTQGDTNMTLYTAIGKYEFRKDTDGNKMPVIIAEEKEYTLDIWEMILVGQSPTEQFDLEHPYP